MYKVKTYKIQKYRQGIKKNIYILLYTCLYWIRLVTSKFEKAKNTAFYAVFSVFILGQFLYSIVTQVTLPSPSQKIYEKCI